MNLPAQLPLSLVLPQYTSFESYIGSANLPAISALKALIATSQEKFIFLYGHLGTGKTHLLQSSCRQANLINKNSFYLPLKEYINLPSKILEGLEDVSLICIDDLEKISGLTIWEEGLFHLFNRVMAKNSCLVISATAAPTLLNLKLQDLTSRLTCGLTFQLQPLMDEEKTIALKSHAQMRGLDLPAEVSEFLIKRCPRDMTSLIAILDKLDQLSLAAQRKLTIPFVKLALGM